MRNAILATLTWGISALLAAGQPTEAPRLFENTTHDFGIVPRGAQVLHRFHWANPEKTRLEVKDIRVSCGCATVTPNPRILEPGQKGTVDVLVDAKKFVGQKAISVQLAIAGERPHAVTLEMQAHSRPDIVYNPGDVNFGVVAAGASLVQTIEIEYAGQLDWRIEQLINTNPHLEASHEELYRKPGQAGYRVKVSLKPDAPAGDLKHELQLKTNDPAAKLIPLLVTATIRPRLLATPNPVFFGSVRLKQEATRRLTIRGDRPFQILKIEGLPAQVTASKSTAAGAVQSITLTWKPDSPGDLTGRLIIHTDLEGGGTLTIPLGGQANP